jgi:hypothetical protein
MSTPARRILYCHCAFAQVVPPETKAAVLEQLSASGVPFDAVPDLCEMTARRDPALPDIAGGGGTIIACFPRAVRWMFSAASAPLPDGVEILNMRVADAGEIVSSLKLDPGADFSQPDLAGEAAS